MQATDDRELLRQYARHHSEEAFATLVSRHIDLVYSAALRHVANHHQAQEITQAVFVILARKAATLSPATVLAGWLFRTTRLTAANYLRGEIRRARREQEAYMQSTLNQDAGDLWREVAPLLNDAIAGLRERDRNAVVLRYLQGKDYKSVAAALGATEEAAQMRVGRALDKLRKYFGRRGVVLSASALGGLLAAQGTQAAPLGLAAAVSAGALHGTTLTASTLTLVQGTLKLMAWTNLKLALGAGVVVLLACQYHQNSVASQRLVVARAELAAGKANAAAQESRIATLQEQTAAILETEREQKEALVQLRARRAAAAQASPSASAPGPSTLLSAMLLDPAVVDSLREQLVSDARSRWGPAVKQLKLPREEAEKLYQIAGAAALKNAEAVVAFTEARLSAEEAVAAGAQAEQAATNQVASLVGPEAFAQLEESRRSFPARSLLEQFDRQLGYFALHPEQRESLRTLLAALPEEVAPSLAGDFTVRQLVYPAELDQRFAQEKAANQRILEQAAAFLAPENVEALALMQAYNLAQHQRTALQILRKL